MIRGGSGKPKKTVTATYTLATTTPLVSQVFEECFSDQVKIDKPTTKAFAMNLGWISHKY